MKLLLITASAPEIRAIRQSRFLNFQQITMPYLAALTPPHWQVEHVDEEVRPVDRSAVADLVGITFHTPSAHHAYDLAAGFRARGIPVVLGGPHVTLLPEEAARHADVIFIGEAEGLWQQFLAEFEAGRHQPCYRPKTIPTLDGVPPARQDLFHRKDYTGGVLFATRGCPNSCDFCTLAVMYRRKLRKRPVAEVAAEYSAFHGKVIIFWDDNIAGDLEYAKALFRSIAPCRKWWSSQASIHAGQDEEFLELAARSGCKQLFLGLESVSQASLNAVHKRFNRVEEYARIIERIHAHGIAVQAGIVFGFDCDTPAVFSETIDFLEQTGVQNATFNILTPFPGTPLFRRLQAEGRIVSTDWRQYNSRANVVFQPKHMSRAELLQGFQAANRRFYSPGSVLKRLARSPVGLWWTLPLNLAYAVSLQRYGLPQGVG
ncbi:MAG TPA: radical SAM protein [Anaerolineaceae bacterium]|nr:radical SAM protein [Anaerolineaceae bacterium]